MLRILVLLLLLVASVAFYVSHEHSSAEPPRATVAAAGPEPARTYRLATGTAARLDHVDISIEAPHELDGLTKAQVLQMRSVEVMKHPELLVGEYAPSEDVFGQVEDLAPWWGIEGQFRFGAGISSIDGPSEESRFILNPFLLVAPEFNDWFRGISNAEAVKLDLTCLPQRLTWWPKESRAEASYSASCIARRQKPEFDLIAYNARDMGLPYIYVSYADSLNVTKTDAPAEPYANPQFIHRGNNCGYPGGCNNMSPSTPPIDGIRLDGLPAKVAVWLWRSKPRSIDVAPDFIFTVVFR